MSQNTEPEPGQAWQRPPLSLDRKHKKVLGVCAGFARYLDVPRTLVRVIFIIACLVSPVLVLVYLLLYWLLEDDTRPARLKAAMSSYMPGNNQKAAKSPEDIEASENVAEATTAPEDAAMHMDSAQGFNLKKPLYRSRKNVRIGGVCAGIADYLNVSAFLVRAIALFSLFVLGGISFWAYVICWIVLDKEPKSLQKSRKGSSKTTQGNRAGADFHSQAEETLSIQQCAERLQATEQRLRLVEACITSRQFRLHCEINRIQ
ncbi:MAG TPA: PspC domain-containing protein [Pseudohongiella sp.]|nr:PspC domain-containing protein [Pseudohongiella sp.]